MFNAVKQCETSFKILRWGGLNRASSRWRSQLWLSHLSGPYRRAGRPPLLRSHSQPSDPSSLSSDWRRSEPLRAEREAQQVRGERQPLNSSSQRPWEPSQGSKEEKNWQRANKIGSTDKISLSGEQTLYHESFFRKCLAPLLFQLFVLSNNFVRTCHRCRIKNCIKKWKVKKTPKTLKLKLDCESKVKVQNDEQVLVLRGSCSIVRKPNQQEEGNETT